MASDMPTGEGLLLAAPTDAPGLRENVSPKRMHLGSPFSPIRADPLAFRRITLLFTCVVVGFIMNVIISAVTPFFPQEAARLANASEGMVGTIMAILPLTSMICYPVVRLVSTQEPKS